MTAVGAQPTTLVGAAASRDRMTTGVSKIMGVLTSKRPRTINPESKR